jgi:membrane protein YdbS with pleckstrin-like domain
VSSIEGTLRLRPPHNRVSRKAIAYWTVSAALFWIVVIAVHTVIMLTTDDYPGWMRVTRMVAFILGPLHVAVMPTWRYRVHRWEISAEAVYTQTGWIEQEWRIAPISRIQSIDIERGAVEQLFGLAKVKVTTASATGALRIHGLDNDVAQEMVGELTRKTQAIPGDAT